MTKKKSILSDQRFIVVLVIIVLVAIFSGLSKEFRQYSTILSMLDFSYYDLLMAIGVTFPLITGGVDLSIGTGMVCYALISGTLIRNNGLPVVAAMLLCDRSDEPSSVPGNALYLYDHPRRRLSLQCHTMAGSDTGRRMVPFHLQDYSRNRKKRRPLSHWFPVDDHSGSPDGIRPFPYEVRTLHNCYRLQ